MKMKFSGAESPHMNTRRVYMWCCVWSMFERIRNLDLTDEQRIGLLLELNHTSDEFQ